MLRRCKQLGGTRPICPDTGSWLTGWNPITCSFVCRLRTFVSNIENSLNPGNASKGKAVWTSNTSERASLRGPAGRALAGARGRRRQGIKERRHEESNCGRVAGLGCGVRGVVLVRANRERNAAAGAEPFAGRAFAME